jgi:hypothetical protein
MQNEEQSPIKNKSSQNCCGVNDKYHWNKKCWLFILLGIVFLFGVFHLGWYASKKYFIETSGQAQLQIVQRGIPSENETEARKIIDSIYKGDYRNAFIEKKPELFLKHIPDDFKSISVEGNAFDAKGLRQFFPLRFANQVRTIEHNVTIEDVDVLSDGTISAIVTLYTLEENKKASGDGTYLVTTIATYRDLWQMRAGNWYEIGGDQLRNQVITAPRP